MKKRWSLFLLSLMICACSPKNLEMPDQVLLPATGGDGYEVGNGGDVMLCASGTYFFDAWEAKEELNMEIDLGQADTYDEKVLVALDRLRSIDPERFERLTEFHLSFMDEAEIADMRIRNIPDEGPVRLRGCEIRQVVHQQKPTRDRPSRYYIDKALWDELDEDNKAVLILHEIIYRDLGRQRGDNSRHVRNFNIRLFANKLPDESYKAYARFLKDLEISPQIVPHHGLPCDMNTVEQQKEEILSCKASTERDFVIQTTHHEISSGAITSAAYVFRFDGQRVTLEGQNILPSMTHFSLSERCNYDISQADGIEYDALTKKITRIHFDYASDERERVRPPSPDCIYSRAIQMPNRLTIIFDEDLGAIQIPESLVLSEVAEVHRLDESRIEVTCFDKTRIELSESAFKAGGFCRRPDFGADGIRRVKSAYSNFDSTYMVVCQGRKEPLRVTRGDFLLGVACQDPLYQGLSQDIAYQPMAYSFGLGDMTFRTGSGFLIEAEIGGWNEVTNAAVRNDQWLDVERFPSNLRRFESARRTSPTHFAVRCKDGTSVHRHQDEVVYGTPCLDQFSGLEFGLLNELGDTQCTYRKTERGYELVSGGGSCERLFSFAPGWPVHQLTPDISIGYEFENGSIVRFQLLMALQ